MREVRPIQKHLLSLPPCPACGGYRYLVARTRSRKNIELQALCISKGKHVTTTQRGLEVHHSKPQQVRTYKTVASIPYTTLDPHDKGIRAAREADSLKDFVLEMYHELQDVVAKLDEKVELVTS